MKEDDEDGPEDESERLSAGFQECFRCTRAGDTRIYLLRAVSGGAELWRVEERPGEAPVYTMESHLHAAEEAAAFLEELRRALRAGGWR